MVAIVDLHTLVILPSPFSQDNARSGVLSIVERIPAAVM